MPRPTYYSIFTSLGLTRLAEATAARIPAPFDYVAVGDGGGSPITPISSMTALVNERARVPTNSVDVSPDDPNTVRVEGLIPGTTGGFTIREAGIFNAAGELLAVASYPPIYKPNGVVGDGSSVEEYIRILLVYENAAEAIAISADPNVIIATRLYVDAYTMPIYFGDGHDGDVHLDGANDYPGVIANLGYGHYRQERPVNLNNITVDAGIDLDTNGFDGDVRGTGIIAATAHLHNDGAPGAAPTVSVEGHGGTGAPAGSLPGGAHGADGLAPGSGALPGNAGLSITRSRGGKGGTSGGDGEGGGQVIGGSASDDPAFGDPRSLAAVLSGFRLGMVSGNAAAVQMAGGAGGGSGGGSDGSGTGGGGGGGGTQRWSFRRLINDGHISCDGGAGGAGAGGAHSGGGGGGGGGRISIVYGSRQGSGSITCDGGAGGAGGEFAAHAGDPGEIVIYDLVLPLMEDSSLTRTETGLAIFDGTTDEVTITLANVYAVATGPGSYRFSIDSIYVEDGYGDIGINVIVKTSTHIKLKASAVFTGEVSWRAVGT